MNKKMTLKQVKSGTPLPAPIYVSKPYVVLSRENVVLGAGDEAYIKSLGAYFDEFAVEARQYDMHANDNTRLATATPEQPEIAELKEMFLAARPVFDPENGEHERLRLALRAALIKLWTAGAMNDVGMTEQDYKDELENFS